MMTKVVAAVIVRDYKLHLFKRKDNGFYECPGGKVEKNETDEQALKRELMEELGVSFKIEEFLFDAKYENYHISYYVANPSTIEYNLKDHSEYICVHFKDIDKKMFRAHEHKPIDELIKWIKMCYVTDRLYEWYADACCQLDFKNPLELMVSTQLSAQCTDKRVNLVTPALFKRYKTVDDYADADQSELEDMIRSTGFFRNKAKNIISCCRQLRDEYNYEFPKTLDEITKLSGVGRKTGNLFLGEIYKVPGIVVDTHVKRLSNRLGFVESKDATFIEKQLMGITRKAVWIDLSHLLIAHGRSTCTARKPSCEACGLKEVCVYYTSK